MTEPSNQSLSKFIYKLISPHKGLLSIMGFVVLVWGFTNTFLPYTLKLIIDHVVAFKGDKSGVLQTTPIYILLYIGLWVAHCLNMRLLDWVKLKLFPSLREDIMVNMFAYLQQHSQHYFQNQFAGSLVNKIIDMQSGVIEILSIIDEIYAQIIGLCIAVITLLFINPIFALILVAWVFAFLVVTFLFLKPIQHLSHEFADSKSTVVGRMVDSIGNILTVRLFARQGEENRYIHKSIAHAVSKDRALQTKIIAMRIYWDLSIVALLGLNLFALLHLYSKNQVSVGDFAFVISMSISVLWNLWFIAGQFVTFAENIGVCKQALAIIAEPHGIIDRPGAPALLLKTGQIQFHAVSFHYNEGNKLFKNKKILIQGGQKVGLVGFSGSGKSSFVNLILRLFEVESGNITIDDQDINAVTQESLRANIALIPQDITLFHRSLLENIRFGNSDATDESVIKASKQAHAHEFISKLPEGYNTMVGERGVKLSGGQRQRIAIARAILKNAPILILDEATSSLDSVTEYYIQESLTDLMQGKTAIVIAHRLSTLAKMDRILVFDKGQIIEDGRHDTLLAQGGHYAKMWHMQAGGFLPKDDS